jgi:hypothetical protein
MSYSERFRTKASSDEHDERMERLTDIINNKLRLRPPPGFEEFSDDLAEALEILQREVI